MLPASIKQQKQDLRKHMKSLRQTLTESEKHHLSHVLSQNLFNWAKTHIEPTATIAVYLATPNELNIDPFIKKALQQKWRVYAPRYSNNTWELVLINQLPTQKHAPRDLSNCVSQSIRQAPQNSTNCTPQSIQLWLIPGLAFSSRGERLGYGKGIYDNWLAKSKGKKIGIGFSFQVLKTIPTEPWDQPLDAIFTPSQFIEAQ